MVGSSARNMASTLGLLLAVTLPWAVSAQVADESNEASPEVVEAREPDALDSEEPPTPETGDLPEPHLGIEEIVVSGRTMERADTATTSVTSFGSSDIQNLRIQNVADLSRYTPNLEINTAFAASNPTLFIRGVGLKDYNSNSTGAVGIWHDGIMMNSPAAQLFSIYDIQSIEVLRGPIGGLHGRNSTAGAILMQSFKPTSEWTAQGSFTYGNLNNIELEGAVGFPIFPSAFKDKLSGRIAGVAQFRDPYTKNVCSNWDPEQYGLLLSTEETTRDFYADLDPDPTSVLVSPGTSDQLVGPPVEEFVYHDIATVQAYNDDRNQTAINLGRLLDGPGGTPGTFVGLQRDNFSIGADRVCLLQEAGNLTTFAGEQGDDPKPEGTFTDNNNNPTPFSKFQGLKPYYNNIKYWGARGQLLFEVNETLDFLGNVHWGQNRGDSLHLQPVGAQSGRIADPGQVITEPLGYNQSVNNVSWSENNGNFAPFEQPVPREGLSPKFGSVSPPGAVGLAGGDVYSGFYSSDGLEKLDLIGGSLTGNAEYDWGRITGIAGYERSERSIEDEGDACPCAILEATLDDEVWQVTGELLTTIEDPRFILDLGAFFIHEELDSENIFTPIPRINIEQKYQQITDAFNVGADLKLNLTEEDWRPWIWQINLDAGLRYNWERKGFVLGSQIRRNSTGALEDAIPEETEEGTWTQPTGEVVLSYLPVEMVRIYTKYTHGYKAGHFNAGLTVQPSRGRTEVNQSLAPVSPEVIDAFEIGLRSTWFDGALELNGALFRYWYKDLQVFDIVNETEAIPTQQLLNADANVLGVEVELTARPFTGLLIQSGFGYLDSTFEDFFVRKQVTPSSGRPPRPGQVATFNYKGNPLIAAPKYSWSGYVEYELPLQRWGSVVPSFDFSYKSRVYLDPQKELLISQPGFWRLGARLAYRLPRGDIEFALWVQNLLDERYRTEAFDLTRQYQQILEVWAEPRTFGGTVSYLF